MLGMDEALLSKIVNGYRVPSPSVRRAIADVLEADETWLFTRVDRDAEPVDGEAKLKPVSQL
jgi:transcriptional regulator with XRE-family HTH domain